MGKLEEKYTDIKFFDVKEEPFKVYGLYNYKNEDVFKRLPDDIGENVNEKVKTLYRDTAGGRVRFSTNSKYVAVKVTMPKIKKMHHMPLSGSAGFDLYLDNPENSDSMYIKSLMPPVNAVDGYEAIFVFDDRRTRYLTINFPLYNEVSTLHVGLQEDSEIGEGMKYKKELPIVYYGSSITQGACASRPGNSFESMIARKLNLDYINLGFAGSALGEDIIMDYMADLPMLCFVSDYDHNAPLPLLKETHCKLYKKIREKHPDIPYVMITRPDFKYNEASDDAKDRKDVVIDTFRYAREIGDKNVYFIDGESFFMGQWLDSCTVDSVHPNDLGFSMMAESILATFRLIGF